MVIIVALNSVISFNIGITWAIYHSSGNSPRGSSIGIAVSLSRSLLIWSGPVAFVISRSNNMLYTSTCGT